MLDTLLQKLQVFMILSDGDSYDNKSSVSSHGEAGPSLTSSLQTGGCRTRMAPGSAC